jgi:EAL domain-containing protein (putative c-di-GMP-specific phosphodiesterase class I)/GGDEF domain-containing protein
MSMYRQLWLALILSTALALTGSLLAATLSARAYLQQQLRMTNADSATTLAQSLSHRTVDAMQIGLAVAALFDSGHFASIRVADRSGKTIVERIAPLSQLDEPAWFIRSLPIAAPAGEAGIDRAGHRLATVFVSAHGRFAYHALWTATLAMAGALALGGALGGFLGTLVLRRLQRPLNAVIDQARAISERRFILVPELEVPELRQLSAAMNFAVGRLKAMFGEEAARLELVRREAHCDALTGLANRAYFLAQLHAAMALDESAAGSLMLVRVAHLAETNRRLGRDATDNLLKSVGKLLHACSQRFPDGLAARLNGADFGLLLPQGEQEMIAHELLLTLERATADLMGNEPVAFIGIGQFHFGMDMSALLAQVDTALASAEAGGISCVRAAAHPGRVEVPRSADQWSRLILGALDQGWARLASFPVADFSGRTVHRECPLRLKLSADGPWLPAGRFVPAAERLGLTAAVDLAALGLGLAALARDRDLPGLALNLSARSIQDGAFRHQLGALLDSHAGVVGRLWLEVAETGALADVEAFRSFCLQLKGRGCRLGLDHFGRRFSQIGLLHDLGLDYLKVDASFVSGIEANAGNRIFLKGLTSIAHNIGLQVFAQGVESEDEMQALSALGFDGATGPAIAGAVVA